MINWVTIKEQITISTLLIGFGSLFYGLFVEGVLFFMSIFVIALILVSKVDNNIKLIILSFVLSLYSLFEVMFSMLNNDVTFLGLYVSVLTGVMLLIGFMYGVHALYKYYV